MKEKELLKLSKIVSRETLAGLLAEDIIKNRNDFNEEAEAFICAHIFKRRTAEKIVEKLRELVFSDLKKNIIVLPVLPDFDMINPPKDFFEEGADWELFRERLLREKEKKIILKEKMTEMIFYYAEENEELRSMIRNI